ncbi:uncharacterized protein LOC125666091 [Ostrea edulis]|uniref:uncharacterized protein LOC125666091 n=1 Tax=Ostrea edulis TaxID=37623 RepID=UPI002094F49C|nr:uncharacterized protein LOC125666091 [Ostrea edulis]
MAAIPITLIFCLTTMHSVFCQLSPGSNSTTDIDPLEESIVKSILRTVDEKFESLSTRMISMERGISTLQYYNLRQFRTVNTHLHTLDNLLQNMHSRIEQQDVSNQEIATSVMLLKREVKNMEMMSKESFNKMDGHLVTMTRNVNKRIGHVQQSVINALNDTGVQQNEVASALREIVVSERDRTKQICSESLLKVETRIDNLQNMTMSKIEYLEGVTMNAVSNMNLTFDPVNIDINATARKLLEDRLQEFNANVLDSIKFYRHTGDLVERIVGATETVADDQTKLREDINHFMQVQVNLTKVNVQGEEKVDDEISNVINDNIDDVIEEKPPGKTCEFTSNLMDEIQLLYRNGSQVLDVIAEMTRSSQNELRTTIQQLNNEVFKLQEMRNEEGKPHPEMLSGHLDYQVEEVTNNTRAVFHIVEAIASNTGWIPYIFSSLQFLENQINQTLLTTKKVLNVAISQDKFNPKTTNSGNPFTKRQLSDDPNLNLNKARNQEVKHSLSEKEMESSDVTCFYNKTQEFREKLDFVYQTNRKMHRILPELTRLLGEPEPFVALVDGESEYEGRVEIYKKGRWGTMCKPLTHVEASYICRHLGYLGGVASEPGYFGEGSGVFWNMNFTCLLSRQCSIAKPVVDPTPCDHKRDYGVLCDHMVRLWFESKSDKVIKRNIGFLEIHHREEWIPVCGDDWSDDNSNVVCRQLGYKGGVATVPTEEVMTYQTDMPIFYNNVTCAGNETRLTSCENGIWRANHCSSNIAVFIQCT